ncbi:hypothetical protein JNUCC31_09830 [Paenibacillus sp. JNUCC31]|uniref:hypothetical protein n=1 Tax=Paenibacillus sp. JNUCC-31 TaxID=2777983 RepID=UPI00177E196B|nr:hypothetical protein [Paenibacillus sp. JNUCC-31]QOS81122.1 hypothetical protein JNUCC31_09830 [Paenibacillus sp. JNUCC-31]
MEPITVLSDGNRSIAYDPIIQMYYEYMSDKQGDSAINIRKNTREMAWSEWGASRYCIIDYQDAGQAVSAANAIRAFMPHIPLLVITDFKSLIRKRHLQRITGTGVMKMVLWQEKEPQKLVMEIQRWLHSCAYETKNSPILNPIDATMTERTGPFNY